MPGFYNLDRADQRLLNENALRFRNRLSQHCVGPGVHELGGRDGSADDQRKGHGESESHKHPARRANIVPFAPSSTPVHDSLASGVLGAVIGTVLRILFRRSG